MLSRCFRNAELGHLFLLCGTLSVLLCAAGGWIGGWTGLCIALLCCCSFDLLLALLMRRRYQRMAQLSAELDAILHGTQQRLAADNCEGELAILHSEIQKMIVRLQEQSENLQADKRLLADALADLSHQLRTPLTSANLILTLFADESLPEQRRRTLLSELKRLMAHMEWLIEVMLKLSRLDAGAVHLQSEPVQVENLTHRALDELAIPLELHGITAVCEGKTDVNFAGDAAWSAEALVNILKNCIEHTPEGGTISVFWEQNAICTEIRICDTGCGFSESDLPHLFERFYRGQNASPRSAGIGLALAQTIVVSQNGRLLAQNNPEGGARFVIRFYHSIV